VTWWGVFGTVLLALLAGVLVVAALMDRRARARGYRYRPDMAKALRKRRQSFPDRIDPTRNHSRGGGTPPPI
jgi:hypothetical protein